MKRKTKVYAQIMIASANIALMFVLFSMQFIPLRRRLVVVFSTFVVMMLVLIFTKKVIWRFTLAISIFIVAISLFVSQLMMNSVARISDTEVVEYVYLRKNAVQTPIESDRIGLFGRNADLKHVLSNGEAEITNPSQVKLYGDAEVLVADVQAGKLDAILTQTGLLDDLKFFQPDFEEKYQTIRTFKLTQEREEIVKKVDVDTQPYTIYVSGIDVYGDVVTRSRSDMNLLIVVNPVNQKILTVTMPRDTYVPLGCENGEMDKLAHTGLYGVACSVKTVENILDIDVNYYVRLNFTGVVDIVNALGGVDINLRKAFTTDSGFEYHVGTNHLSGESALAFARERKHLEGGDVARGGNHRELLRAVIEKMTKPEYLMRLPKMSRLFKQSVDTNLSDEDFSKIIASHIEGDKSWHFSIDNLDGVGDMATVYSLSSNYKYYIYRPDLESLSGLKKAIENVMLTTKEANNE